MSLTTAQIKKRTRVENINQRFLAGSDEEESFRIDESFLEAYKGKKPNFGFNGLGEFVYYRTYSRIKPDGNKETFLDTIKRVIEGCFEIQRRHQRRLHLPWDYDKAQPAAQEMFDLMWNFKFLPPGRGLWMMGTNFMWERGSAALQNCAFCSTYDKNESDPAEPFCFLMDMSMLGVGVGFDTKGAGKILINKPKSTSYLYRISDSREGWVDSVRGLMHSYTINSDQGHIEFDYQDIRPAGQLINGFGGKASGPDVLVDLHDQIRSHLDRRVGSTLNSVDIVDIMNCIGACVVAGNVRRSSEVALGDADDVNYCEMKTPLSKLNDGERTIFVDRLSNLRDTARLDVSNFNDLSIDKCRLIDCINTWNASNSHRWASNNSVFADVGIDYTDLARSTSINGEPGYIWLNNMRDYGRMVDGRQPGIDGRVSGTNPCIEQSLESYEVCVAGDTVLQLRDGIRQIHDLVGKDVEIWNGDGWSQVTPRITGRDRKLYRVHLSDGSYLDTTANHGWSVKPVGKRIYRRIETKDLIPGCKVLNFSLGDISGRYEPNAFEMGYIAGDGYRDTLDRPRWAKSMAIVCGGEDKRELLLLNGVQYKSEEKDEYNEEYTRYNLSAVSVEQTEQLRCIKSPIPEWVFEFDRESVLEFIAGWIESDGSLVRQPNTADGYRVYGTEPHMRSLQLLLRRVGINHASTNLCHPKGQVTNKGTRKYDLWYIQIPSFESGEIPTRHKVAMKIGSRLRPNPRYPDRMIDAAKKQKVVRVEELPGLHTTYCFDEPENHMAVFGNSLTYQCNLVETFPVHHEDSADYMRTLKFAYLYGKTVTLLPTHNIRTNQVTLRNRRIGVSQSGIVQAFEKFGRRAVFMDFCDAGYNEIRRWDNIYSEWLCVPKSIKVTSVKPSGCRPWYALTTTSYGILSLEELFEISNHKIDERWSDFNEDIIALQGERLDTDYYDNPIDGQLVVKTIGDKLTRTYDNGISDTIIIKLSHNIELESTPNHRWFVSHTYSRNRKQRLVEFNDWKRTDELTDEDVVQIVPGIYSSHEHTTLRALQSRHIVMRGGGSYKISQPPMMNPDLAWLLGYMWGDGSQSFSKFRMRYSDEHLFNLYKAQRIILDQFNLETKIHPASQGRKQYALEIGSKELWHWLLLNECLKIKSNADLIPKCVRASSHDDIIAFLAGLCDSDGCIGRRANDQYAIITMSGKLFAKHVQDVALAVGIVFSRSHNTRGENFQKEKSMWSLSSMQTTLTDRFEYFKKHCNKVSEHGFNKPWSHETGNISRILGKVVSIKEGKQQRTYDVEIGNSHWYYAGAVKSHNTVSLVAGVTPGIHYPESNNYWRRVRISRDSILVDILRSAGYHIEDSITDEKTVIIKFAVSCDSIREVSNVSMWEQIKNVADYQRYWADNQVSCTIRFKPEEARDIVKVLMCYEDSLKGISFLPMFDHGYVQAPYEACTKEETFDYNKNVRNPDYKDYIIEAVGSNYCDNDSCEIILSK